MNSSLFTPDVIRQYLNDHIWDLSSLSTLCERNSVLFPAKEAVVDSKSRLTWMDVKQQSDRLAIGLRKLGLTRDDMIIAQLYNCVEMYLLIVACQKAGIVLATVSYNFRESSMIPIIQHINAKAAIIPWNYHNHDFYGMYTQMRPQVPGLDQIIVIGDEVPKGAISFQELSSVPITDEEMKALGKCRIQPYEVSMIGTTGGTTGIPKLTERIEISRMASAKDLIDRWELKEADIFGAFYNLTHGTPKHGLTAGPMVGAKLVLAEHPSTKDFFEIVEKERITIACVVPTQMVRILDYPDLEQYDLSSLRLIANSTDMLPYELGVRAEEKLKCLYVNTYGASDTGDLCVSSVRDSREVRLRTVGRPYDLAVIKIVDEGGKEVPKGEVGEIMAQRGPLSASGYYKNQEMNESVWQTGWFDLNETGWFDQEGNLTLVGRKRNVIKRGGQRIAPRDVEDLIMRHPDVKFVAVVGMPDAVMGQKLCAYIVPMPNKQIGLEEIVAFLKSQQATPFLIPERVELIAEMPVLLTGQKVDRRRLEEDIANKLKQEAEQRNIQ
jgi:non-ribosomal peptide synthetase component E (peptide arylation enzyme)